MIKKNLFSIILATVVLLLPIIVGLCLWDRLPELIVTHFGVDNVPDGYQSKAFTVFFIPLFLLGLEWLCLIVTALSPKSKNISDKVFPLLIWIIPVISVVVFTVIYLYSLGIPVAAGMIITFLVGFLFILLGNYMPKAGVNHTFGYRIPWTLNDPENWAKTHRLAGKVSMIAGFILVATAYWQISWLIFAVIIAVIVIPVLYSFIYYKKNTKK